MRGMQHAWGIEISIAFVWETGTERPFGRPRHRRVDNIKTVFKKQDDRHGLD